MRIRKGTIKRLMIASHASNLNGAELCFIETIKALHIIFPGVKIFCVFPKDGPLIEECKSLIFDYEIIDSPWWIYEKRDLSFREKLWILKRIYYSVKEFRKYLKLIQPELVISNTIVSVSPSIAAILTGVKHVWYVHELGKEDHGYKFMLGEYITKRMIGFVSKLVLVNSWFVYSRYKNLINKEKLKTIYQPVTIPASKIERLSKTNDLIIVMVGRFAPGKGQFEAIEAIIQLINKGEEISLVLVGATNSDYDQKVKEHVNNYNLEKKIRIVDFTRSPEFYYKSADIAIVCSKSEAFGRVTIEAMKYGLPVIASDTGANIELIHNGFNGIYYEAGNIEDLMANILKLKDIELRKKIANNALKWANENFNLERYSKDLGNLIKTILS